MVTNTNKQDICEFFLWSDYSPLTPGGCRARVWGSDPSPSPVPLTWARGGRHIWSSWRCLALSGFAVGENLEMREPLALPSPLAGWAGECLG